MKHLYSYNLKLQGLLSSPNFHRYWCYTKYSQPDPQKYDKLLPKNESPKSGFFILVVMYFIPNVWLPKDTCILGIIKWQGQHFQKCPCKELEVNYDILYELDVFDCRKLFCRSFVAPGNPVVNNWLVHSPVLFLLQRKEVFSLPPH